MKPRVPYVLRALLKRGFNYAIGECMTTVTFRNKRIKMLYQKGKSAYLSIYKEYLNTSVVRSDT
jgi:hypothetical protein